MGRGLVQRNTLAKSVISAEKKGRQDLKYAWARKKLVMACSVIPVLESQAVMMHHAESVTFS